MRKEREKIMMPKVKTKAADRGTNIILRQIEVKNNFLFFSFIHNTKAVFIIMKISFTYRKSVYRRQLSTPIFKPKWLCRKDLPNFYIV